VFEPARDVPDIHRAFQQTDDGGKGIPTVSSLPLSGAKSMPPPRKDTPREEHMMITSRERV